MGAGILREAIPFAAAVEELQSCAGSQFDPVVVAALTRVMDARERRGDGGKPVSLELVLSEAA